MEKREAITFHDEVPKSVPFTLIDNSPEWRWKFEWKEVDYWKAEAKDIIFRHAKGSIVAPISFMYGLDESKRVDIFVTGTKKGYNSDEIREHVCKYLNYFEHYYDLDKEYLSIMSNIKVLIDTRDDYGQSAFFEDIGRYILSESLIQKVERMVADNYQLDLKYRSIKESLQYTNDHAKMLMCVSLVMNMCIPLLTHFAYKRKVPSIDPFIMLVVDHVIFVFSTRYDVDLYAKIYETATTTVSQNENRNKGIWDKQDIRGKNGTTHSLDTIENILLNLIPKYVFNQNAVNMNYSSIKTTTGFQITDIEFEFSYVPLSSSKRDEDNNSEFDKFEAYLIKQNEALYLQNKINCAETMKNIEARFGPFDPEEIEFHMMELRRNGDTYINAFQKQLVFNLFYKYFIDPVSINAVNVEDYVKLILAAKKILEANRLVQLPAVLGGRVEKLVLRKVINKRELTKLEICDLTPAVQNKYRNEKIMKQILSIMATIIASDFTIVDYNNKNIHGLHIDINPDIICVEILMYFMMI